MESKIRKNIEILLNYNFRIIVNNLDEVKEASREYGPSIPFLI